MVACGGGAPDVEDEKQDNPEFMGATVCKECHVEVYQQWQDSHHDWAMAIPSEATVLGDFSDVTFTYGDIESLFFRRDEQFWVRTDGPDGKLTDYPVAYTFGVEPLQQYLVAFPEGRLQALSIAWDTRDRTLGGQRWFHLYPDEAVDHQDPLHWTGPMHNWNHMCAECHSTQLEKNYDPLSDTFATEWKELNVACEACHGPGFLHVAAAKSDTDLATDSLILSLENTTQWQMQSETGIATPSSVSSRQELNVCARCHSRRSAIASPHDQSDWFLNTHRPALLQSGLYYPDGQVRDEVYVYGSFLQSKMHLAGVTCSDCHNPHTLAVKGSVESVCAGCHAPGNFDTPAHHGHHQETANVRCVDCHMPETTYMVVDPRRDHSFRIPRPGLSEATGSPDPCIQCHQDQSHAWAQQQIIQWHGEDSTPHFGSVFSEAAQGGLAAQSALLDLIQDETQAPIVRATAMTLLDGRYPIRIRDMLKTATAHDEAMLRLGAAQAGSVLPINERVRSIGKLLRDPVKAVRLEALVSLLDVPKEIFSTGRRGDFEAALSEYLEVQGLDADRPEAQLNLARIDLTQNQTEVAITRYNKAISQQSNFAPSYLNLADLYRRLGQESDAYAVLKSGLEKSPENADLHHALGLSLVRQNNSEQALLMLRRSYELAPNRPRFAYVLAVALNSLGDTAEALAILSQAHGRWPDNRDLLLALTTISRDSGRLDWAGEYAKKLVDLYPDDPTAQQLFRALGGG